MKVWAEELKISFARKPFETRTNPNPEPFQARATSVSNSGSIYTMASIVRSLLPTPARLQTLQKLRSQIFGTTFNPLSLRTGSKVLKARLRGPAMLRYYGERMSGFAGLNNAIPNLELRDVAEETRYVAPSPCPKRAVTYAAFAHRLIDLETRRKRGKVTPKKGKSSPALTCPPVSVLGHEVLIQIQLAIAGQGRRATMKKR